MVFGVCPAVSAIARRNFILNSVPGELGRRQCVFSLTVSSLFYNCGIWDTRLPLVFLLLSLGIGVGLDCFVCWGFA